MSYRDLIYKISKWGSYFQFVCLFVSAATKTKTTKATQKKKGTKGAKTYESSTRWRNINIEFGPDLGGEEE